MSMATGIFCYEISSYCLRIWRDDSEDKFLFKEVYLSDFSQEVEKILEEFESDDKVFNITDD
jgi:DUF971 family protein